ncbi:MAG: helix-turn-helix transcriptional regulator [Bacteroidales bacterium]|nr:helix-turn-helix transcriptional regulator [Bacteroidales bacterium]
MSTITENRILRLRNMNCRCCIRLIQLLFKQQQININYIKMGELDFDFNPRLISYADICKLLQENGFEITEDREQIIVEQIKIAVIELIHQYNNSNSIIRNSDYLVERTGYSYQTLSGLFSKHENKTLEKFIIAHKIEKVKELLEESELTLSEIAFQMGYSSVQYLSSQFKSITSYTVSDYKKLGFSLRIPFGDI